MAEIKIRPALATDLHQTVLIEIGANAQSPVVALPWKQYSHKYGLWLSRHLHFVEYPEKYQFLVATIPSPSKSGEEEIVGYLQGATPKNVIDSVGGEVADWHPVLPEGTNKDLFTTVFGTLIGSAEKYKTDDMWELESMSVSVDHQRMGIGSKLIQEWLRTVDKDGRSVYILASVKGKGMYEKHGAREVGYVETDLSGFGVEKPDPNFAMVRKGKKG